MVKTVKLNNITNNEIKVKGYDIPQVTNQNFLNLHFKLGVVGSSGQGKTTAVLNFLRQGGYLNKDIFTTIVLISPSGTPDPDTGIRAEQKWENIATDEYTTFNTRVLKDIIDKQKAKILRHKQYLEDKKLYRKFIEQGEDSLTPHELIHLYDSYNLGPPTPPFGVEHFPTLLIILDDCVSDMKKGEIMSDFMSRSRHVNASVILICQHFTQMSRGSRKQLDGLIMFATKDEDLLTDIWKQSVSGDMKKEKWLDMFKGLENRKEFIMTDFKADNDRRYRKNFNEYFIDWQ